MDTQTTKQDNSEAAQLLAGYVSEATLAAEFGKTTRTLRDMRQCRTGPPWITIGRTVYYSKAGIAAWLKSIEVQPVRERKAG